MAESITVTAAEANRSFSKLLRHAREGRKVTITSHGKAIAELSPVVAGEATADGLDDEQEARRREAFERLKRRWATVKPITIGPWTRDELYDRDQS